MKKERLEIHFDGRAPILLETGHIAKQADGAVMVTQGETVLLVPVVSSGESAEEKDFFPLLCDYREQISAAGKIPGGFFKREGRPTERETLVSRLIDRSVRPLFLPGFKNDVQITPLVLSSDQEHDPDILSVIGASAALTCTTLPFSGPMGAVRVGYIDGTFIINPTRQEMEKSAFLLVLSGTESSLVMMEGTGNEIPEEIVIEGVRFGFTHLQRVVKTLEAWKKEISFTPSPIAGDDVVSAVTELLDARLPGEVFQYPGKKERAVYYANLLKELESKFPEERHKEVKRFFEFHLEQVIRRVILTTRKRLDGRVNDEIRNIECMTGLLPRTHGSALFTRGQTQCLASLTLGTSGDQQIIDGLFEEAKKRFMLHYNFPGFSVGEVTPNRGASRREIGHGALAERSLLPVLPSLDTFPYTLRLVANILESNGSSSMATVCASSLALFDGGVPVTSAVAGVALGMIKEGDDYILLTDIAGEEDHYGDLDLKFAGTEKGITGFQMDVKTLEFSWEIFEQALLQSRDARLRILNNMNSVIHSPRTDMSRYAPKIITFQIKPEKIGAVIGSGGKVIRKIIEETGADIDIEDSGIVTIASVDSEQCAAALQRIKDIVEEPEPGKIYEGIVSRIFAFGAMVKFMGEQEGLVHISELAPWRVSRVEDIASVGAQLKVKVLGFDDQGRINLSHKQALSPNELEALKAQQPQNISQSNPSHESRPPRHGRDKDRKQGGFRR